MDSSQVSLSNPINNPFVSSAGVQNESTSGTNFLGAATKTQQPSSLSELLGSGSSITASSSIGNHVQNLINDIALIIGDLVQTIISSILRNLMPLMGEPTPAPDAPTSEDAGTTGSSSGSSANGTNSSTSASDGSGTSASSCSQGSSTSGTSTSGSSSSSSASSSSSSSSADKLKYLKLSTDSQNLPSVKTSDGYTISFEGKNQAWTITTPDGQSTRIWGDPHVEESDGDKWDFQKQSSFKFGNNKITVETQPLGNGTAYTSTINIYHSSDRITISGINSDKPSVSTAAADAKTEDAKLADGDIYKLSRSIKNHTQSWKKQSAA